MAVKKKTLQQTSSSDSMSLSRELLRVREAITHLPTDEGAAMNEATTSTENSTTESSKTKKKPKKVAKKAVSTSNGKDQITLAEVCKSMKIEPRTARRILRNAEVKNPGRWSWPKGHVPAAVKKALSASKD